MNDDENGSWDYKPDGQNVSKQPELPSTKSGKTHRRQPELKPVSWTASEYIDHSRGPVWYILLSFITVLLAAAVYFLTKDRFATGLVAVVGIIVAVYSLKKPQQLTYELSESGLRAGEKVYTYRLFKSFAIIHEGALSSITFLPIKKFMPPLSIFFDAADEEKIVKILGQHLPYEQRGLDSMDRLTRRLRF
ncbi:hypothetical protein HYW35_02330 [Candidatus Saccharibacteria bacterium]|nr:hypothetical protein [Candidatus Saccharibacteria bacterium]